MTVAFLPVPTNVIGHFGGLPAAAIFYALSLTATGLVLLALWRYASAHHRLVDAKLDAAVITHQTRRAWRSSAPTWPRRAGCSSASPSSSTSAASTGTLPSRQSTCSTRVLYLLR